MKRRQLKWIILALISGMTIPFLMLTKFHGASLSLITIISLLSFTFSVFMFGMTKDYTIKEIITTFTSSLKFEEETE